MRILHTADWHLGDRLGRIDRTADLRRAVERVAGYCEQEKADVLLVAGDLFSELSRPDGLRDSVRHLQDVFLPFLRGGGTIVAITGNHDNENFCQTLCSAMALAAPVTRRRQGCQPRGRLYLASRAGRVRLADRAGRAVDFVLLPYPTPTHYLDESAQRFANLAGKNRALQRAFRRRLRSLLSAARDPAVPTVLAVHLQVVGASLPGRYQPGGESGVVLDVRDFPEQVAYVALGHVHRPQALGGRPNVRYSGSIERLDLGESGEEKGVVLVEVGPAGLSAPPRFLPLAATPVYEVRIDRPREQLPVLRQVHPDAEQALVRCRVTYQAGRDNLPEILDELDRIFPRWYDREWQEANALAAGADERPAPAGQSFQDTVLSYLRRELAGHPDAEAVLRLAGRYLAEAS